MNKLDALMYYMRAAGAARNAAEILGKVDPVVYPRMTELARRRREHARKARREALHLMVRS